MGEEITMNGGVSISFYISIIGEIILRSAATNNIPKVGL